MEDDEIRRVADAAWFRQWEPVPDDKVRAVISERKVFTDAYAQALKDVAEAGGLDKMSVPPRTTYFDPKPARTRPPAPANTPKIAHPQ